MVEQGIFIFLGTDEPQKQQRLDLLKKKLFPQNLSELNTTVLYGDDKDLEPAALTEALSSFPMAGAGKRLVVIRMAHKLSPPLLACLEKEGRNPSRPVVVVLDVPQVKGTEELVGAWRRAGAEVVMFKNRLPATVFDLGRAIMMRQSASALALLNNLMEYRESPERILGGLYWQWERSREDRRLTEEAYARGLKLLAEADKRLKTSAFARRQEDVILEMLVVRLSCAA